MTAMYNSRNAATIALLKESRPVRPNRMPRDEAVRLLDEFQKQLAKQPGIAEVIKADREAQVARRLHLFPPELRKTVAAFDAARSLGRTNLFKLLSEWTDKRHMVRKCGGAIHIAVCNYEMHQRKNVRAFEKIGDQVVPIPGGRRAKSATKCLQHLKGKLSSKPYIWAKAWAAMSSAAREALILGHPGRPIPIFVRTPSPAVIEPLLTGAIEFAARPRARTQTKRDDLHCTILVAYRLLTQQPPALSRSPRNPTLKFIRLIEQAYSAILPDGFDFPISSQATLHRLRKRSLFISDL